MIARTIKSALLAAFAAAGLAAPAHAVQEIESFSSPVSDTQAGAHPDITTAFALENPGGDQAAKQVIFNMAEGYFGNPSAITRCTSLDFALDQCPSSSQEGLVTVRANVDSEPDKLLGTAPVYSVDPQNAEQTARFAFVLPTLNIPINIPIAVRTGGDFGLRFTVSGITQVTPLASAKITFWGYPAEEIHDTERFPIGTPGAPPSCPGAETTSCLSSEISSGITVKPLIDSPRVCGEEALPTELLVETYQDPGAFSIAPSSVPPTDGCRSQSFAPLIQIKPTTTETDAASRLD